LQNNPLYLETMQQTGSEGSLRFHYIVHCSLDAVEEKCQQLTLLEFCIPCLSST
jgi:hypothetical protein